MSDKSLKDLNLDHVKTPLWLLPPQPEPPRTWGLEPILEFQSDDSSALLAVWCQTNTLASPDFDLHCLWNNNNNARFVEV